MGASSSQVRSLQFQAVIVRTTKRRIAQRTGDHCAKTLAPNGLFPPH
ncbi:hypothetical protein [Nostoc sp.]